MRWIELHMGPDDVLYDVGANVGAYSLIAAAAGAPGGRVVAFEPHSATYASLCENIDLNRLADRVSALPVGLAEASRIGTLYRTATTAGTALHSLEPEPGTIPQALVVLSLDDLVGTFGLPAPTLLKLDVDGGEVAVLEGGDRVLSSPRLRSLVVEIEERNTDAVIAILERHSFRLAERVDERFGEPLPGIWYGVFERQSRPGYEPETVVSRLMEAPRAASSIDAASRQAFSSDRSTRTGAPGRQTLIAACRKRSILSVSGRNRSTRARRRGSRGTSRRRA